MVADAEARCPLGTRVGRRHGDDLEPGLGRDRFREVDRAPTAHREQAVGAVRSFDDLGNVVGNIYIRRVEKKGGQLVNAVIKTYPNVSQFWTYNPDEFLKNPVYNRETWPANKNLEP